MKRIAVLCGGISAERQVSLDSGEAVLRSLQRQGFEAIAVDTAVPVADWIQLEMDCAFVALHGPGGEDGRVQGVLELMGVPYTGSGVLASALAMDKWRSRQLFERESLPVPPTVVAQRGAEIPDTAHLGKQLFVKPNSLGSSIGCNIVGDNHSTLEAALADAWRYSDLALIEPRIEGEEYFVGILDGRALPAIRVECSGEFYNYEAKYQRGTQYFLPCGLSAAEEKQLSQLALQSWQAIGGEGWGRVDIMRENGQFQLMEVNTVPGLTEKSLVPMAAAHTGMDFDSLVGRIVALARKRCISHLPIIQSGGKEPWITQES